jgi:2-iminoacetate synthase
MSEFLDILRQHDWDTIQRSFSNVAAQDVESALNSSLPSAAHLAALLSPAAAPYLEAMAQKSRRLSLNNFGRTVQMFAPLYLSNRCTNVCTYCGFSVQNKIPRRTLTTEEILIEGRAVRELGYEHVLLVTGEDNLSVDCDYFAGALDLLNPLFSQISLEVQPLEQTEYERLRGHGLYGVLVYQESYHEETYRTHHPRGKKSHFEYRLETPERLGRAGIHKIGLGALIGLEDWRTELYFLGLHLQYLRKKFWRTKFSVAFPRLRPAAGFLAPKVELTDRELVQAICAFRLFDPHVEISLSTRESPVFRNHAIEIGITTMSAASKTEPGGYALNSGALEQFSIHDTRSVPEVVHAIRSRGYEPVWKDWEPAFTAQQR